MLDTEFDNTSGLCVFLHALNQMVQRIVKHMPSVTTVSLISCYKKAKQAENENENKL